MKKVNVELDVDFIGNQDPLTKEEELAISNFIAINKTQVLKKKKSINSITDTYIKRSKDCTNLFPI